MPVKKLGRRKLFALTNFHLPETSYDHLFSIIFQCVVFFICFCGMSYQAGRAIKSHLEYPSVVSSTLSKEFNLSRICSYYPKNCTKKDVMYRYSIPKVALYAEWRFYGQPIITELFDCHMVSRHESCPSFECDQFMRRAYFKIPARFCFVFDALQLPKDHLFYTCSFPWLYELQLTVTWNDTYMLSFMGSHTLPVYVHRTGTNPPMSIEAISMFPDMLVEASAVQQTIERLPRPFRTDCEPYEKGESRPTWGGRLTFPGCVQQCKMAIEQEICNCTMPTNEFSGAYVGRLCEFKDFKSCEDAAIENQTMILCQRRCHLGCQDVLYDVKLAGLQRLRQPAKNIHQSGLVLSMASASVETFVYSQAIESEMTFGYVSGYIGVWTGLSFAGIAEGDGGNIFEAIFNDCEVYPSGLIIYPKE